MPTIALLNQAGEKLKDIELDANVFGVEPNQQVIFDVVYAQRAALRHGTHDTKNRTEVRGGGRKPWKQKGTGRARQGSIRATQWVGGGVPFGPTPRSYAVKTNRKVAKLGFKSVLSAKILRNEITVVDKIELAEGKTKQYVEVLNNLNLKGTKTLVVMPEIAETVARAAKNVAGSALLVANHVSVLDIMTYKNLVLTLDSVKYFEEALK